MEDVYWTYSYSPAYDDEGQVAGVFVTCTETTGKVHAIEELQESKNQLQFAIDAADLGTWELNPLTNKLKGNNRLKNLFGLQPENEIELSLALDLIAKKDRDKVTAAMTQAMTFESGGHYAIEYTIENPLTKKEIIVKAKGKAYFNEQQQSYNFSGTIQDVTEEANIRKQLALEVVEQKLVRKKIEESEAHLQLLRDTVPAMIFYLDAEQRYQSYNGVFMEWFNVNATEAIGKTTREFIGDIAYERVLPYLTKAYAGQQVRYEMYAPSRIGGRKWFDIVYTPHINSDGNVIGIIVHAVDITKSKQTELSLRNSEARFRALIEEAPVATCFLIGKELKIELANEIMLGLWGKDKSIIGMFLKDALPEIKDQSFLDVFNKVYTTGKTYSKAAARREITINGVVKICYFNYTYKPLFNEEGEVYGIMDMAIDVTEQVLVQQRIEQSQRDLLDLFENSPVGIALMNADNLVFRMVNKFYSELVGRSPEQMIGKSLLEAVPELEGQGYEQLLQSVIESRLPLDIKELPAILNRNGKQETIYTSFTFQPRIESDSRVSSLLIVVVDVTNQVLIRKKIEESELFSREVIANSPVAKIVYTGAEMTVSIVNENMLQLIGRDSILGKTFREAIPELAGSILEERMNHVFQTGITYSQAEEKIDLVRFGKPHSGYFNYIYKALRNVSGDIYGIMATATEVTAQVDARKIIEAKEKELRDLITAAPIGICVLNRIETRIEEVNERFILISGKKPEQYTNATYWEVFPEVEELFAPVLENVFRTGIKFTSEETEMLLIRSGVPEKIYATFEYLPVVDNNNQVTKVIVLVVEVTYQVEIRKQIEEAVANRTKELAESNLSLLRSNAELEQFAYIASHDLQEPIRKISTFTQMLEYSLSDVNDKSKSFFSKIYASTDRMSKLIRDVLAFSQVSQNTDSFMEVDLAKILQSIETDYELLIEQKQAIIEIGTMPVIQAMPSQMTQLFSNLMSNSLKYTRPDTKPVIKISASVATEDEIKKHPQLSVNKKYYHIEFSDNGIGFDKEHVDRIFQIFQRLHGKTEFDGTGIGLAICRKIVQSHMGHISASAGSKGGAVFNIILPN